jgi:hypothetical protein
MPAIAEVAALPFRLLFLVLPTISAAVPAYADVAFFNSAWTGAVMAAVLGLARVRMRAVAGAMASLCLNLVGGSPGPVAVGALSDALQPAFGNLSLRYAIGAAGLVAFWAAAHFAVAGWSLRR